ncbi:uncharacterized protein PGTG_13602 [Puccinia graminis f. sp. tritici CRL 75-36-700-3]|uniref:Uncharacterized protein n=1 Tax=Puccinia graminis f. sp. tritici (strain CRL 75-36-700-3 / race SCCL) TaxID=418459 RepID=E3KSY8_PUCGT|nr:uncharacterized protein PGTG_13602 [Puccinia graminis f. sp. tritici CRL 75-36-700-3]EFP87374.2 hypothetical protein PGTG_13602 [Puccinia graminis f. sp. tritici CRL 75-36-700-3]
MNDDVMFVLLRIGTSVWFMDDDDRSLVIPETSFLPHTNTSNINSSNSKYNSTKKTSLNREVEKEKKEKINSSSNNNKSTAKSPPLLRPPSWPPTARASLSSVFVHQPRGIFLF